MSKILIAGIGLFSLALIGCGPSGASAKVAKLEGNVKIGGAPLPADAAGSLVFMPAAKGEARPVQATLVGSHYQAANVPVGKVTVIFHISRTTGKMLKTSPNDVHPTPEMIDLVTENLRGGQSLDVAGDNPQQDFDLK